MHRLNVAHDRGNMLVAPIARRRSSYARLRSAAGQKHNPQSVGDVASFFCGDSQRLIGDVTDFFCSNAIWMLIALCTLAAE